MKLAIKLKILGLLFTIYLFVLSINWYTNLNLVERVTDVEKTYLTSDEIEKSIKNPQDSLKYFYKTITVYDRQNSKIPFVYNKKIISEKTTIYNENCGCL